MSHTLSINIPPTCLPLVAVVESVNAESRPNTIWQQVEIIPLQVSGISPTYKEMNLDYTTKKSWGRGALVDEPIGLDDYNPQIRVKLCLENHPDHCGEPTTAECKGYKLFSLF